MTLPKGTTETQGGNEPAGLRENFKGQDSAKYWRMGPFRRIRAKDGRSRESESSESKQKMSREGNIQINFPRGHGDTSMVPLP